MVRLKDLKQYDGYDAKTSFNSNMVRLKVNLISQDYILIDRFNSNMVRLKAGRLPFCCAVYVWFQFQYGAIKRFGFIII